MELNTIFTGGISCKLSKCSITKRLHIMFSKFGTVFRIQVSTKRTEDISGFLFAHVQLLCTSENLRECLLTYKKCIWKGKRIVVEKAKPNFIQMCINRNERDGVVSTIEAELPTWNGKSVLFIEGKKRNSIFVVEPNPSKVRTKFPDVRQKKEEFRTIAKMESYNREDLHSSRFHGIYKNDSEVFTSEVVSLQESRSKVICSKNRIGAASISKTFFR